MDALLRELEFARQAAKAAEVKVEELTSIATSAKAAADELAFDEATTRTRLIDSLLASAGWDVAAGEASTEQVGKEIVVNHQPTESGVGYADYVLWDDNGNRGSLRHSVQSPFDKPEDGRHESLLSDR
jgi:type I restriction enzyme, R subunit